MRKTLIFLTVFLTLANPNILAQFISYDSENRIDMNEAKDEAIVKIKITFENDNTKESNVKLVKQNGVWKLKID